MRVAEKLDWKGLKIKKSVGNRKIIRVKGLMSQVTTAHRYRESKSY
jgi:hypothetical protein